MDRLAQETLRQTRPIENIHIALWLMKDISWVSDWHWFGMFMVIPTLFVAIHLAWRTRHIWPELAHNLAVCFWVCANIVWMVGEFFYDDGTRAFAKVFFYAGMTLLVLYYSREATRILRTRTQLKGPL